jgi:hypothetical protein
VKFTNRRSDPATARAGHYENITTEG